ncbi:MAG: hypothetical protein Kow0074_09670 [Candidatus Zixiibacteriota bacterium]
MSRFGITILILLVSAWNAFAQTSGLILNEALSNEPGSDVNAEWVEVLNWPDSDSAVVCLDGYRLIDGIDTSYYDSGDCLQPGGFLVIARNTATFESIWGDNSGVWGDHETENYALIGGRISLRNSSDTLVLIGPDGDTSTIYWTSSNDDGRSWERIRPNGGDGITNFAECTAPDGSTPGRENSVLPVVGDLAVDSVVVIDTPFIYGVQGEVVVHYTNVGLGTVPAVDVEVFDDLNFGAPGTELGLLFESTTRFQTPLGEGQSSTFHYRPYSPQLDHGLVMPGLHRIVFRLGEDGNPANNEGVAVVAVEYTRPLLIISEFLADPEIGGPDEWVEIVNLAEQPLSMRSLRIGDSSGSSAIPLMFDEYMPPGQYWVLAENEAAFLSHYPHFTGRLVQVPSWPSLNNTGDRVTLIGAGGEVIDSVSFRDTHGDNRSWERLEMTVDHAMIDGWTISVDPSGATPGRENSIDPSAAGSFAVTVSPNPMYLSAGDKVSIAYRLEIGERLTLKVFDRTGRLVRTLASDTPAATGSVVWDATNDDGAQVRPGPYVLLGESRPAGSTCKDVIVVAP